MGSEVVAGVDIGSSSARAVAIDRDGGVVATAVGRYDGTGERGVGEVDPAVWLAGLSAVVGDLDCATPAALGVGGHGPTTVASTGDLALTFRHPAGATSGPVEQHIAQTAVLRDRFGDHVGPRQSWDFLLAQLGGDPSIQSVWPTMAGLPEFGTGVAVGSSVGTSTGAHGIPEGIALVPGSNDAYMTAWATAIDTPGRGFDPGGKTGGLGVAVAASEHQDLAEFGMPSHVPGVAIVGGPVAAHGAIMDWWAGITGRDLDDLLEVAATVAPGSGGVMALPFLEGEPQGVGLDRVVSSGGPSRSRLWTSIKAAVLEVPIDVPASKHMAAYGAALAAGAAVGWWPRPGEGKPGDWPMPAVTTIKPEPLDIYREGLDRFIALGDEATARLQKT
jgi:xylulokinase